MTEEKHKLVLKALALCLEEGGIVCELMPDAYSPPGVLQIQSEKRTPNYKDSHEYIRIGRKPGTIAFGSCQGKLRSLKLAEPDSIKLLISSVNYCFTHPTDDEQRPTTKCNKCPASKE